MELSYTFGIGTMERTADKILAQLLALKIKGSYKRGEKLRIVLTMEVDDKTTLQDSLEIGALIATMEANAHF